MIFNSCLSGRKWQGPALSGTWCLSCLRAMHPFTLQLRLIVVAFFFSFIKKTKRKSHWQPTNHNKKKRWTETLSLRFKKNWKHIYMHICRCTSVYIVLRLGVEPVIIVIPSQISLWTVLLSILCCFLHIIFSIPLEYLFKSTNEPIKRLMRGRATEMRGRARQRAKKKGYQVRFLVFAVLLIVSWPVHFICIGVKNWTCYTLQFGPRYRFHTA